MKQLKLELPNTKEEIITIADISNTFRGVIIALKNNTVVGMIIYDDSVEIWYFTDNISISERTIKYNDSLMALIKLLLNNGTCDSFNVIKFE